MAYQATEKSKSNIATMPMTRIACSWMLLALTLSASLIPAAHTLSEAQALLAFKDSLHDPQNVLRDWNANHPNPCSWSYIKCDNAQSRKVVSLFLITKELSGLLVPELGSLSKLSELILAENDLSGPIPAELGNLKFLTTLNLRNNRLSGSIPPSLGKLQELVALGLDYNQLSGKIPSSLATLKKLKVAAFNDNKDLCWDFWPTPVFRGNYSLCQKA